MQGSGVVGDPYIITTEDELRAVNDNPSAHYKLGNHITVSGTWTPLGYFTGVFDGDGYTIRGIYINDTSTSDEKGFFRRTGQNATIKNLGLEVDITTNGKYVGGLVGRAFAGTVISNCYVIGRVHCAQRTNSSYTQYGGLVGRYEGYTATISNCYAIVDVSGYSYVGGLVGYLYNGYIDRCYAAGTVVSTNSTYYDGFCGNGSALVITRCYFDKTKCPKDRKYATGLTTEQMQDPANFLEWDFDTVWRSTPGEYHTLQVMKVVQEIIAETLEGLTYSLPFVSGVVNQARASIVKAGYSKPLTASIIATLKRLGIDKILTAFSFVRNIDTSGFLQGKTSKSGAGFVRAIAARVLTLLRGQKPIEALTDALVTTSTVDDKCSNSLAQIMHQMTDTVGIRDGSESATVKTCIKVEVMSLVLIGDTVRLRVRFKDYDNRPVDVSDCTLTIMDDTRQVVDTFTLGEESKVDTGVFVYDYTVPEGEGDLIYEFATTHNGKPVLIREKIERKFV